MASIFPESAPLLGAQAEKKGCCTLQRCLLASCCVLVVLLLAVYLVALKYLSDLAIKEFVTLNDTKVTSYCESNATMGNLVSNIWWPGCGRVYSLEQFDTKCGAPCYPASLMKEMQAFNAQNPGVLVQYPSRVQAGIETVQLAGWWLPPVGANGTAPRVVLQHGFTENSNMFRQVLAAYMLRRLGFGVLMNNFRDHGYSQDSQARVYEWGHAYPYDVLGAWDYLRTDPEGKLGGPMESASVGLMGFSKGAFTVANSFGLESSVPAAWIDSPPYTPEVVFNHGASKKLVEMGLLQLAPILLGPAWSLVLRAAAQSGVDLEKHLPRDMLPKGPDTRRPISVVGNANDDTVPLSEMEKMLKLLAEFPSKYNVTSWKNEGTCAGLDHCVDHLHYFDEYLHRLCNFWSHTFGLEGNTTC